MLYKPDGTHKLKRAAIAHAERLRKKNYGAKVVSRPADQTHKHARYTVYKTTYKLF